jgi:transcriptional regulator with XRE-family HTH domain
MSSDRSVGGDFCTLLRECRERRRLSQLDLAALAGTTQRHLSFVEQGRSRPGRALVARLAESLGLPLRDRNRLLLAAGFAPAFNESSFEGPELATIRQALQQVLDGHQPFPALVTDAAGLIIARNAALDVLTEGCAFRLLIPPVNALRLALHPDGVAPRIENFAQWAPHVIDNLRRSIALNPDPRRVELLDELVSYVVHRDVSADHVSFAVPMQLRTSEGSVRLVTTAMHFATGHDVTLSELRLEAFLPVDQASSEALTRLAKRTQPEEQGTVSAATAWPDR